MPKVTVLNCPSCGAPLPTDSLKCDFCGARVEISDDRTKLVLAGIACPKCGWDNAASRLFCGKCGENLMQRCHNCGAPNPVGLHYCGGCGLDLGEARRLAVEKLEREAEQNGWYHPSRFDEPYVKCYEEIASPDETVIVFVGSSYRHATVEHSESGQKTRTGFVATDQSFIFLEPARWGLSGRQPAVAQRVPFDEVESLTADAGDDALVIKFKGGQARVNLHGLQPDTCLDRARGLIHYFKPFLPLRLQQGW
jgi:ribosomal protein S27AE